MKTKIMWKVGDWCINDFDIWQITEMRGEEVTSLSNGIFNRGSSSFNNEIFPLSLKGKNTSNFFHSENERIHREARNAINNWPDIHRHLCTIFTETMEAICNEDEVAIVANTKRARHFCEKFSEAVEKLKEIEVDGVYLIR